MPFFVPSHLVESEYFDPAEQDEQAKPYQDVQDFAFFCVNFGYSRADYNALTPLEKAFIYKAYEDKFIRDNQMFNMAVSNAVSNVFRDKGKSAKPLFSKKAKKADKEIVKENVEILNKINDRKGRSWVDKILKKGV